MHQLFVEVLTKRDLSRAGDLFLIDDKNIVTDLSILINEIQRISNSRDFNKVNNDQSVIEICLARITSAIRDSGTIEEHGPALVSLLESCLQHDLKPSKNCEDPPHAKIVSDLVSCIFLNHNKKSLMKIAIPVAVKLLHRGNKDLSRNLSSYLSIAVLNNAEILAQHIQPIIDSIIGGNYSLVRVLPRIYVVNKEPIHDHVMGLVCLLPQCETPEKLSLLNLFSLISKNKPNILESNLSQLSECLAQPQTASPTLQIMLDMAQQNPRPLAEYTNRVINACELQSGMLWMAAQFFGIVGRTNYEQACDVVHFLVSQLSRSDLSTTITLLREIKAIVEVYPSSLLPEFMHQILLQTENSSSSTVQNYLHTLHILSQRQNAPSNTRAALRINCDNGYQSSFDQSATGKSNSRCVNSIYTSNSGHPISPSHQSGKIYGHIGSTEASINRITSRLNGTGSSYGSTSNNTAMARNFSSSSNGFHRSMTTLGNPSSSRHQINRRSIESIMAGTNAGSSQKSASSSYLHALYEKELSSKSSKTVATSVDSQLQQTMGNPTTSAGSYRHYSKLSNSLNSRYRDQKAASIGGSDSLKQSRSSLLEPYSSRDAVQHFCEKHIDKIKNYMQKISVKIPLPVRCTIEEKKSKKIARLHFVCQGKGSHCLYNSTFFTMKTTTRNAPIWIHIMFLALQSKAPNPLCTSEQSVGDLKKCWDTLKADNRTFLTLVTSSFPSTRDQDMLMNELRSSRYFDVFEFNALANIWGCFLCNHPDRANEFLHENEPVIEGPLKEKRSKWKLFRRWRTHYFTLSGLHLSYRESSKSAKPVEVGEVLSVKAIPSSRGRAIPKAFEIFTNSDKTYVLKSKSSLNNEQWVQCLSIAMAHSQAKDTSR
ncbi:ventricular zone expressed PH domain-containing protein melted isoform X2 [Brevipalpus obovatus]|uniref:ventricular zone expressed PH domain-containing protein melted isoform X2 n=1 Tax=Brevipalpus obovatus TaxID=246614 RepID=UPI003D9EA57B